jgi:hypothetical protein
VLSAGMRESVVRQRFRMLSDAFLAWESALAISKARSTCRRRALVAFNHQSKIRAIIEIAERVAYASFEWVRFRLADGGLEYLRTLPFMGPVTSLHLAKNIGLQVAKPDRHLSRIAKALGVQSVATMCALISEFVTDPIPVVDVVLWRFATIHRHYAGVLQTLYESESLA